MFREVELFKILFFVGISIGFRVFGFRFYIYFIVIGILYLRVIRG